MKLMIIPAAIGFATFATTAVAQIAPTQSRVVRTADLNLSNANDVRRLEHRLSNAIVDVCGSASAADPEGGLRVTRCRHDLAASAGRDVSRRFATAHGSAIVQTADADIAATLRPHIAGK